MGAAANEEMAHTPGCHLCAAPGRRMVCALRAGVGHPPLSITHPRIEYLYAPNQDVRRFGKRFLVNDYSMRSAPFAARKGRDERRVLVFGDSVVNGGNLTNHQDLATTRLAHDLRPFAGGNKVVVGNVSAGSWGPGNWLAYSQAYGFLRRTWSCWWPRAMT